MPVMTFTQYQASPGTNLLFSNRVNSSLDLFAAAGLRNRKQHRLRRNRQGVQQDTANLLVYSPMMKADTVIEGVSDRWHEEEVVEMDLIAKKELSERDRKIIAANSAAGILAAPAAMYGAIKASRAHEGGVPRTLVRGAANLKPVRRTKPAKGINRVLASLDKPKSRKALVASGILGGASVALQGAAIAGDTLANRATRSKD